ncbi:hypothetical protein [Streptomyces sp. NBC_01235]|uniref:hypothetical protein n=1 Tax=Streptomyces sp. NBC_01235 TaxID=2903788 RepID=UPI002E1339F1|nr:hypothetical protein OG289_02250 [Streptomyces sp. NBC_01235]
MTNPPEPAPSAASRPGILRHRPAPAAVGATAPITFDMEESVDLAPALAASALVHFAAAALRRAAAAWPLFFTACAVIFATELLDGGDVDPTWVLLALAAPLLAHSLRPGALDAPGGLPLQVTAMLAFGGAAALTLGLRPGGRRDRVSGGRRPARPRAPGRPSPPDRRGGGPPVRRVPPRPGRPSRRARRGRHGERPSAG